MIFSNGPSNIAIHPQHVKQESALESSPSFLERFSPPHPGRPDRRALVRSNEIFRRIPSSGLLGMSMLRTSCLIGKLYQAIERPDRTETTTTPPLP